MFYRLYLIKTSCHNLLNCKYLLISENDECRIFIIVDLLFVSAKITF